MTPDVDPGAQAALQALGASVAAMNAQVASLQAELFRSLNGVEKVTEKGFESVGKRLDKMEERQLTAEKRAERTDARLEVLEEKARERDQTDKEASTIAHARSAKLEDEATRFAVWQIIVAAIIGTLTAVGTLFGIIAVVTG